ncbi:MAG: primosomal protein N' [Cytophagales bacterium]|nr:primosomal protein N' [Cytophagales bacterium]
MFDTQSDKSYIGVIVPRPLDKIFTYYVPEQYREAISPGSRVLIAFGNKQIMTAVVYQYIDPQQVAGSIKPIIEVLESTPTILPNQLQFISWMSRYYMCTAGEVLRAMLPSGFRISTDAYLQINPEANMDKLTEKEHIVIDILQRYENISAKELAKHTNIFNIQPILSRLIKNNIVLTYEEIKYKYKPSFQKKIRFVSQYIKNQNTLKQLIDTLEKKPAQQDVILKIIQFLPVLQQPSINTKGLPKNILLDEKISVSALNTLVKNNILEEFNEIKPRISYPEITEPLPILSVIQQKSYLGIITQFEKKNTVLLHGITGSGKTEIYIHLIHKVISEGQQALYMLPEIALTTQIVQRLVKIFGKKMGVYHSKFSDNERVELWNKLRNKEIQLVLGVRSSIFLPFTDLGLIVIDEEHEPSYKQYDPAPRYHARDAALYLAQMYYAKVLLGSATPSVETYFHTQTNKWGLETMTERYHATTLPQIHILDIKQDKKDKKLKNEFSEKLYNEVQQNLVAKKQTLLFQNRRGYAPYIECTECGHVPYCKHCDVSLTYHMRSNYMICHYCGYKEHMPHHCIECGSKSIKTVGFGTEKLEQDTSLMYANAHITRIDQDTASTPKKMENIVADISNAKTDIVIGTQMVAKGFDFDNITLVGIFDIDRLLHYPDFRSHERVYQLITQVAGRAGRKIPDARVYIQTAMPAHPVFAKVQSQDYQGFYNSEIEERKKYGYPPFTRIIKITVKDSKPDIPGAAADKLTNILRKQLGSHRVLGPEIPYISKIREQYIANVLLKIEKENVDMNKVKNIVYQAVNSIIFNTLYKSCYVAADVDPVS